jgi:N-acetylglucosamine-6-sulfatase
VRDGMDCSVRLRSVRLIRRLATTSALCGCLAPAACGSGGHGVPTSIRSSGGRAAFVSTGASRHPNIVFVLTDDLSANLLRFMPHVQAMETAGARFDNYFVADSLCCPSRASIFTGDLPHNTGVLTNFGADGGVGVFHERGDERRTFAVALRRAGYLTAMMGKYLNGYLQAGARRVDGSTAGVNRRYVPPGWTQWDVAGWAYGEFDYQLNQSGAMQWFGHARRDYLTDVLARKGVQFIAAAARRHRPFFLELSTFAPHAPFTPAPRNARDFPNLKVPWSPSFNRLPSDSPSWLRGRPILSGRQITLINRTFRQRARAVEAVDRMIGEIQGALRASGHLSDTYIVFSSDNGLHMGQYRLMPGKGTAFDTDVRLPLIVTGPGITAGTVLTQLAENIDLAPTFAAIGHAHLQVDGHSLLALLLGTRPLVWRNAVLIEHHSAVGSSNIDPDSQPPESGNPGSYHAIRASGFLYVEYADDEVEFYDLRRDPSELHNIASRLSKRQRRQLHRELRALKYCSGANSCWKAMHIHPLPGRW